MPIKLVEYGSVNLRPDVSGVVSLQSMSIPASGMRALVSGVDDLAGSISSIAMQLRKVNEAEQWATARLGMRRFEIDFMQGLAASGEPEQFGEAWRDAVANNLPDYLPVTMSGAVERRVALARVQMELEGGVQVQKIAQLAQVARAKQGWLRAVHDTAQEIGRLEAEELIDEATGVLATPEEAQHLKKSIAHGSQLQ